MSLSMTSYWYMALLPLDQVDPAAGAGRAVGVLQGFDRRAALRLLAVIEVGGAERPDAFAVADRRPEAFDLHQVDQVGLYDDRGLVLAVRFGGLGGAVVVEQLGVAEPLDPVAGLPEHDF